MKAKLKIIIPLIIAVAMIISAVLLISFGSVGSEAPMSAFETAQQYLLEHNYEQAIIEFEKALELDPMNVEARLGLVQAYQGIGDTAKAAEVLQSGYGLTGDERLNDMLKELTREEAVQAVTETETIVTTVPETSAETTEAVTEEEKIFIPDLTGLTEQEAVNLCNELNIPYDVTYEQASNIIVNEGYVMRQEPDVEYPHIASFLPNLTDDGKLHFMVCSGLPDLPEIPERLYRYRPKKYYITQFRGCNDMVGKTYEYDDEGYLSKVYFYYGEDKEYPDDTVFDESNSEAIIERSLVYNEDHTVITVSTEWVYCGQKQEYTDMYDFCYEYGFDADGRYQYANGFLAVLEHDRMSDGEILNIYYERVDVKIPYIIYADPQTDYDGIDIEIRYDDNNNPEYAFINYYDDMCAQGKYIFAGIGDNVNEDVIYSNYALLCSYVTRDPFAGKGTND